MNLFLYQADEADKRRLLQHIICWALFIMYEIGLVYYSIGELDPPYIYVIYYSINITYFYMYVQLLNASFNCLKPQYFSALIKIIVLLAGYIVVKLIADYSLTVNQLSVNNPSVNIQGAFVRNLGRGIYFTVLATFYWSAGHISYFRRLSLTAEKQVLRTEKEKAELETQVERSRAAYFQQQINPHMIFNSLNFVYNTVQIHSDDAAHCIWLLSEIMRFSLEEAGPDGKILVSREKEQIDNLISINQYRFSQPLWLQVDIDANTYGYRIIPLVLLTLTENLFKHGNLTEAAHPAILKIKINPAGELRLTSRNLKKSKNLSDQKKGLGLVNTRVRLDAAYGNKYQLTTREIGDFFELSLSLDLCA